MKALTFSKFGGSEVLEYIEVPKPQIKTNQVLVEMKAIGLNYADIYRRKGNYHLDGKPPYIAGYEGSGIIKESKSKIFRKGQRVAFADVPFSNAQYVAVPESHLLPVPVNLSLSIAASTVLQGLTAHYLALDSHKVKPGETVVVHAASGGVGQILVQICKLKGAKVIGLTRSKNKINTILKKGADKAILLNENWKEEIMKFTENKGVDVVYDSIGSTLLDSIEITKNRGSIVIYGMSGGDPAPINPRLLMDRSITLSGGDLWSYLNSSEERILRTQELFNWIINGEIVITEPVEFNLNEGKKAHDYLEKGKSQGKILLIP